VLLKYIFHFAKPVSDETSPIVGCCKGERERAINGIAKCAKIKLLVVFSFYLHFLSHPFIIKLLLVFITLCNLISCTFILTYLAADDG